MRYPYSEVLKAGHELVIMRGKLLFWDLYCTVHQISGFQVFLGF